MSTFTILIGGDTVPGLRDRELFVRGDRAMLFSDMLAEIEAADVFALNLECPLTDSEDPLQKIGPKLRADPRCIKGLTVAHAVNMANNHVLDYGRDGVLDTIELCKRHGIAAFGAGDSLSVARQPLILDIKGQRVGLLGVAENEFSSASASTAGAYGLDIIDLVENLREHRSKMDFCVLLYHGGNEYYPYPSPRLQDLCRFLIREGANAVICQHSHCAGCYEKYLNGLIVYGQGNLIFEKLDRRPRSWSEGFLVKLRIGHSGIFSFKLLPYIQSFPEPGLRSMDGEEAEGFLRQIDLRSQQVLDRSVVEALWRGFCDSMRDQHLGSICLPPSRVFQAVNRRLKLADRLLTQRHKMLLLNLIRCESHRDVIKAVLGSE